MFRSPTAQTSDFAIDSGSLPGPLSAKLQAAKDAGFAQVLLSTADLALHPHGVEAAIADVRGAGLKVTALRGLDDFNGWEGQHREFKFELVRVMLELCKSVRAPLLVARTSRIGQGDAQDLLTADLRRLAVLAIPFEVRIAYELAPEPAVDSEMARALDIIERVEMPNIGICLDAASLSADALSDGDEGLDLVSLVRVADDMPPSGASAARDGAGMATTARVFPGEGLGGIRIGEAVKHLERRGYRGPWVFDANHPDYRLVPARIVADRAGRSARWLAEDVLRRSVPLPQDLLAALRPRGQEGTPNPINNP